MKNSFTMRTSALLLLVLTAVIIAAYESPLSDTAKTMALWNMDSTGTLSDGKVIVFDQDENWSRTNRHLTLYDGDADNGYGANLVSSQSGFSQALQFDGVNDYAKSFIRFPINASFKLELWLKQDSSKTDLNWIAEVPDVWRVYIDTDGTRINLYVKDANGNWSANIRKAITADAWNHITVGFDDGVSYLSVDGTTQYGELTLPTNDMYKAGQEDYVWLGCRSNGDRFFKGLMDDVRLTDPDGTVPEWATAYEDTVTGTYALYHFDEFVGSVVEDDTSVDMNRTPLDLAVHGSPELVSDDYPKGDPAFGSSVSFDGMTDYFMVQPAPPYGIDTSNFRIEAWVKMNPDWYTVSGGLYWIIGYDSMFRVYLESQNGTVSGTRLRFFVWGSDGNAVLINAAVGELVGWNHIACEFKDGVGTSYVNGAQVGTNTLTAEAQQGSHYIRVGSYDGSSRMFWGQMDELRISSAEMPDPQCGDYGYLESDLNKDCIVGIEDLKMILADWLKCTADEIGCESSF
jgi:hypothetical protein